MTEISMSPAAKVVKKQKFPSNINFAAAEQEIIAEEILCGENYENKNERWAPLS